MTDIPVNVVIIDGVGDQRTANWMQDASGNLIPQSVPRVNDQPVSSTNGLPIARQTIEPIAPSGSLVAGGSAVAQILQQQVSSPGVTVVVCNPATVAGQGISPVESIWIDLVTTAQASGGSTSIELSPGTIMTFGPTINAISWIANTGGHRIGAYVYT